MKAVCTLLALLVLSASKAYADIPPPEPGPRSNSYLLAVLVVGIAAAGTAGVFVMRRRAAARQPKP